MRPKKVPNFEVRDGLQDTWETRHRNLDLLLRLRVHREPLQKVLELPKSRCSRNGIQFMAFAFRPELNGKLVGTTRRSKRDLVVTWV